MKKLLLLPVLTLLLISCKQETAPPEPDSSKKELLEKYIEVWNTNDSEILSAIMADEFKRYGNGELEATGTFELATMLNTWHTAMPDIKITLGDITIKDDKAFYYWTGTGTNTGNFGDLPPSGKSSTTNGFGIVTFNEEGKILKEEAFFDLLSVFEDWGYQMKFPEAAAEE